MNRLILLITMLAAASCVRQEPVVEQSFPDGTPKKVSEYKGSGQERELVKETYYYQDKKVEMTGGYKHGKRDGYWVSYYDNGKKWSEGFYKDGMNDGKRTTYFESGKVRYIGYYLNDRRVGKWQFFDEAGNLLKEVDYSGQQSAGEDTLFRKETHR
jgi:antitoxin component YwqK of YwqJK toxin-antitoxin module